MNEAVETVLWGFAGGLLAKLLQVVRHANLPKEARPILMSDPMFWVSWASLGLLGGLVTLAYERSGVRLPPIVAINIGASAPLIADKLISTVPSLGRAD